MSTEATIPIIINQNHMDMALLNNHTIQYPLDSSFMHFFQGMKRTMIMFRSLFFFLVLFCISSCSTTRKYNSLDLDLLPCEKGDSPVFFKAIEFNNQGLPQYSQQIDAVWERLHGSPPVTDIVVFVHGWNKNPSSAELDYQNFLCRLHARQRSIISSQKESGEILVLGVFWNSTITNKPEEPALIKPVSYYKIRKRVDHVAKNGIADFLEEMTARIEKRNQGTEIPESKKGVKIHLVGHSFGGRMVISALEELNARQELKSLMKATQSMDVVLINSAIPESRFNWISEAIAKSKEAGGPVRFHGTSNSYLFNIHSYNDSANRVLFPIASLFNDDIAKCAAGACGISGYPTACVDETGKIATDSFRRINPQALSNQINVWNIDASSIVFDHSDIYKGRMAMLIADLIYDEQLKNSLPTNSSGIRPAKSICPMN